MTDVNSLGLVGDLETTLINSDLGGQDATTFDPLPGTDLIEETAFEDEAFEDDIIAVEAAIAKIAAAEAGATLAMPVEMPADEISVVDTASDETITTDPSATDFKSLGLPEFLTTRLEQIGFTTPTPIQEQTIPFALEGHDVIGSAQTGTGKTAAYVLPLLVHLTNSKTGMGLILTPTREIALQVAQFVEKLLGFRSDIRHALLIGGEPMFKQFKQLQARPRLIIGTPGRVNDHLRRSSLNLGHANFLVLDEMDRMLDIGFDVQLDEIAKFMPDERQTLLFSATFPPSIEKASRKYVKDGKRVSVGSTETPTQNIKQETIFLREHQKAEQLAQELEAREGSIIIFAKTKRSTEKLCQTLDIQGHDAEFLHGDLKQNQRARTIQNFLRKKFRILVATDVAARGIDIPHIEHVINYDLPQCPEDYIHRIGRTARAGAHGSAITFVSPDSQKLWNAILHLMNPSEHKKPVMSGRGGRSSGRGRSEGKPFGRSDRSQSKSFGRSDRSSFSQPRGPGHGKKEWSPSDTPRHGKKEWSPSDTPRHGKKEWSPSDTPRKPFGGSDRGGYAGKSSEGRNFEGRGSEGRFEKRSSEGRGSERSFGSRPSKGQGFEDRGSSGRKGVSSAPRKPFGGSDRGGYAGKSSEGRPFEGRGEGRSFEKRTSSEGRGESRSFGSRPSKGQGFEDRGSSGRKGVSSAPRKPFGRSDRGGYAGKSSEGRPFEGRGEGLPFGKRTSEGRGGEGRSFDKKPFEGRAGEGRSFGKRSSEGRGESRSFEKRTSSEGRGGEGRSFEGRGSNDRNGFSSSPRKPFGRSDQGGYAGHSSEGRSFGNKSAESRGSAEGHKFKPWEKSSIAGDRAGKKSAPKPVFGGGQKPHFSKTKGRRRDAA